MFQNKKIPLHGLLTFGCQLLFILGSIGITGCIEVRRDESTSASAVSPGPAIPAPAAPPAPPAPETPIVHPLTPNPSPASPGAPAVPVPAPSPVPADAKSEVPVIPDLDKDQLRKLFQFQPAEFGYYHLHFKFQPPIQKIVIEPTAKGFDGERPLTGVEREFLPLEKSREKFDFLLRVQSGRTLNLEIFQSKGTTKFSITPPLDRQMHFNLLDHLDFPKAVNGRLRFPPGTQLRVGVPQFEISASEIIADNLHIIAAAPAAVAGPGQNGAHGSQIRIKSEKVTGRIRVDIFAQDGGDGADAPHWASPAKSAEPYTVERFSGCGASDIGPGRRGENGNAGRNGSDGGSGGNAGKLILEMPEKHLAQFELNIRPGKGGRGGLGAPGQKGGVSVPGEQVFYITTISRPRSIPLIHRVLCPRPPAPPNGLDGDPGRNGREGQWGRAGEICHIENSKHVCKLL